MNDNGTTNGPQKPKRETDSRPVPGLDVRELIAERNWAALAGLGLIGVALLHLLAGALDMDFNLWSLLLLGIGGWLGFDAYRTYEQQNRTWAGNTRNRLLAGGLIALIGLMGLFDINWWGLMLIAVGGWLGYDTYQKAEATGAWTGHLRNRAWAAGLIGGLGLLGFIGIGTVWAVILIAIGGYMLYRHFNAA